MARARAKKIISAVICTYNRYDLLPKAIESCLGQSLRAADYEILVIDNSPAGENKTAFKQRYAGERRVKYILEETPGLSNARNVAAREAASPIVAYLDDDAIADAEWLAQLVLAFETFGDEAAIVGGRIDPIWEIPRPSFVHDEMLGMLTVVNWGGTLREAAHDEWVAGANVAFRVAALQEIGGFSTALGRTGGGATLLSNEESAVIEKLRTAGYKLIYAPDAQVDHLVDARRLTREWLRKRTAWQAVSDLIKRPQDFEGKEKAYWGVIARYMKDVPPRLRPPAGLFTDTSSKNEFQAQLSAVYCLTALGLMGAGSFDDLSLDF